VRVRVCAQNQELMILSAQGYVCVCERERAIEYACVRVCAQKQEHMIVSAQVCVRERE